MKSLGHHLVKFFLSCIQQAQMVTRVMKFHTCGQRGYNTRFYRVVNFLLPPLVRESDRPVYILSATVRNCPDYDTEYHCGLYRYIRFRSCWYRTWTGWFNYQISISSFVTLLIFANVVWVSVDLVCMTSDLKARSTNFGISKYHWNSGSRSYHWALIT